MSSPETNGHSRGGDLNGSLRRRRRPTSDDADHEPGDEDDGDDGLAEPPRAKRMRPLVGLDGGGDDSAEDDVNETYYSTTSGRPAVDGGDDGDDDDGDDGDDGGADDVGEGSGVRRGARRPAFQPGAIVRVLVENFVTYERAEFNPGPSLNMVIGPNGTGKSSLVCAICLGLGFHSNVLGRATAFGDFVKHGRDHAVVEVELQAAQGSRRNRVVRLRISREDNSRKFWLDGREAPLHRVQALMHELRIQVDNLCQFLPQDRVAEFAGLNAVDLLAKTLEAAAPLDMKAMQATLRDLYRKQRGAEQQLRVDTERLRALEGRHQAQQADVDRFRERADIQRAIDDLDACAPLVRYYDAKRAYAALRRDRRVAARDLAALQERLAPALQAVDRKQAYHQELERARAHRRDVLQRAEQAAARALARVERVDAEAKEAAGERAALAEAIARKKREMAAARQKITTLEARRRNAPPPFAAADWNMKIREQEHRRSELDAERQEMGDEQRRIRALAAPLQETRQELEHSLRVLDSRQGQQLSLLRRISHDAHQGWLWLEANQGQFEKPIFGPPIVTCAVKDPRYADLIQSLMQHDDFVCFTAQTIQDHRKLSDQLYGVMGLSVTIRTCATPRDRFRSPLSADELAALGLDGLAIDYLEGPDPVLAMLCAERHLHSSPVGLAAPRPDQYERIAASERISTWVSKDQSYRINRRREYGAHAVSTAVRDVRPGRYWTAGGADLPERVELQRRLANTVQELQDLSVQMRAAKEKEAEPAQKMAEVDAEIERLRNEKNQLQSEYNKWQALPEKIEAENNLLSRVREEHADLVAQRLQLAGRLDGLVLAKARAVLRHAEHVAALGTACRALADVQVRAAEAASDVEGLRAENAHLTGQLAEKQAAVAELAAAMQEHRAVGEAATQAAGAVAERVGAARYAELEALARDKTAEGLAHELAAERAKLELTRVVDAGVLDEYERRAREMERLRASLQAHTDGVDGLGRQIAEVRGQWEPRLDALVARINDAFSYNFEQINCAGEVSVHKDDDFDKWAMDIRVKFRENEQLQKLDQHRQSGGERAVSTIFYLMALQGMAQAPFRVVDEINQGMDPRNERMMHERMVEIACHEHTSQYFLITPKLLPGLRYDENMTVLCIASGQYVPDNEAKLDFRRCMQIQRQLLAAA